MRETQKQDEADILAVYHQLTELMINKNTKAMDEIVDKDFTLTHMTGYLQPKKEWFAEIESEGMKYYSAREVSYTIEVNDDHAELVTQNLVDARIWGTRNTWRLQQRMLLEKRKDRWIILQSIASSF